MAIADPRRTSFPSVLVAKARTLCSPPSPHLSRLQLQDRIRIIHLDITSGTSPVHLGMGCCWWVRHYRNVGHLTPTLAGLAED